MGKLIFIGMGKTEFSIEGGINLEQVARNFFGF